MDLQEAKDFLLTECIEPWRVERRPGTFAQLVAQRVNHFGPRLRRVGFEPTASEIKALTSEILAELDPQPAKPAAASRRAETRPAPSEAEEKAAMDYIEQRKRELGIESTRQGEPLVVPIGDFEQDIVARFKNEPAIRAEFRTLETYAAFRQGVAAGTIRGYDANGEKLMRIDPVARAIRQADDEDRSAGVDPRLPVGTRAEQVYGLNPQVRAEFREPAAYVAWRRRVERSRG